MIRTRRRGRYDCITTLALFITKEKNVKMFWQMKKKPVYIFLLIFLKFVCWCMKCGLNKPNYSRNEAHIQKLFLFTSNFSIFEMSRELVPDRPVLNPRVPNVFSSCIVLVFHLSRLEYNISTGTSHHRWFQFSCLLDILRNPDAFSLVQSHSTCW